MPQLSPQGRRDAAFLFDDNIIARPLTSTGIENVVSKNPALWFKWANCSFQDGFLYEQAKAKGYVNATPVDAEVPGVVFKDGHFKSMDLILMKIDRNKALGEQKYNVQRALRASGSKQDGKTGERVLKEALGGVSEPPELKRKMSVFTPNEKDLKGIGG